MTESKFERRTEEIEKKIEKIIKGHRYIDAIDALFAQLTASSILFVKTVRQEHKKKALSFVQCGLQSYLHVFHDELSKEVDDQDPAHFSYNVIAEELRRNFQIPLSFSRCLTGYILTQLVQILNTIGQPHIKKFEDVVDLLKGYLNGLYREKWLIAVKKLMPNIELTERKSYVS